MTPRPHPTPAPTPPVPTFPLAPTPAASIGGGEAIVRILVDPVSATQLTRISDQLAMLAAGSRDHSSDGSDIAVSPRSAHPAGAFDAWRAPLESLLALARSSPDAVVESDSPPLPRSPFDTDETPPDKTSDDAGGGWRWYTTLARRVATIVRGLPPDAKTLFLRRNAALADGRVERLLATLAPSADAANRENSNIDGNSFTEPIGVTLGTEPDAVARLEELALRYPIGAAAVRALTAAGELAWRSGSPSDARRLWTDALDARLATPPEWLRSPPPTPPPAADVPTPVELAVRLVVASLAEGDTSRAERELAIVARRYPDATGRFGGTERSGVELLRAMIDRDTPPPTTASLTTPSPTGNMAVPDDAGSVTVGERRFTRTVTGGGSAIEATDLAAEGRLLWRVAASEPAIALPGTSDFATTSEAISDAAFDAGPFADGRRVYTILRGRPADFPLRTDFTPPAETILGVLALDADTGRPLWRRPIVGIRLPPGSAIADTSPGGFVPRMWIAPTDGTRRTLRIETNFHVTATLDRHTGTPGELRVKNLSSKNA